MKKIFTITILCFSFFYAAAQISDNSVPYSFSHSSSKSLGQLEIDRPEAEIKAIKNSESFDKVYDFGVAIPVSFNLIEEGTVEFTADGKRIARHIIKAEGAYGINLNFKTFKPGKTGKLWIYSEDKSMYIGGFDYTSVTEGIPFATMPVKGEFIIIEFVSDASEENIAVEISEVVYEFADFFSMAKAFGSSGACNKNVNCPEYADKGQQKRSVAMILTQNNVRWCSGALVNNVEHDGKPYFLTARHCNTTANSIFMFNYESPNCTNIDGPTNQSIQGCTVRVDWTGSDVTLVELSAPPPANYFAYFSGWNASNSPADSVYGIHHPKGDIKKISFDYNTVVASPYSSGDTAMSHWKILNWEVGTTESGSSGSPLFNDEDQIVGQLHGGQANCANSINDYYGKFAYSWYGLNTPETALKFWLDPNNTGVTELNGAAFDGPEHQYDLAITGFAGADSIYCGNTADWVLTVRNEGIITVYGFSAKLFKNGTEVASQNVTATLAYGNSTNFTFEDIAVDMGSNTFEVRVQLPSQTDEDTIDNTYSKTIQHILGDDVTVSLQYDLFSSETKWGIYGTDGSLVYQSAPAGAHELVNTSLCLPLGCYIFRITDNGDDGICCSGGEGSFSVTGTNGGVLVANETFTDIFEKKFCVPGLPSNWDELFEIYPNPSSSLINVKVQSYAESFDSELIIFSADGKVLINQQGSLKYLNTFDVSEWANGIYFVRLRVGKLKSTQKFIKN